MTFIGKMLGTALFGTLFAAAPAMAQTINTDNDQTVNFLKYRTYTVQKVHATDPAVEGRMLIALNRDLASKYLNQSSKAPDLIITIVESNKDAQEYSSFYDGLKPLPPQRSWGSNGFFDSTAAVTDIPPGTLVLDMYDAKTQRLVWRGMATAPVSASTDKNDQTMEKLVDKLISKFPPKAGKKS